MDNFEKKKKKYLEKIFGNTIDEASERQIYQALMVITRDRLAEKRFESWFFMEKLSKKIYRYVQWSFLIPIIKNIWI